MLQTFFIKKILNSLESFNESHLIIYQILTLKTLNLYKKMHCKTATLSSLSDPTVDDRARDEKLQCNVNREVAKISALSSDKNNAYEYLTSEKKPPSNQSQVIEVYLFFFKKSFRKTNKNN